MTCRPECLPGGSCSLCNPPPIWCQGCLEVTVENPGDLCPACQKAEVEATAEDAAIAAAEGANHAR